MMKESLVKAYSTQANAEWYSAYLYLAMCSHADSLGLKGFANWLYVQYQEEMAHGNHMYQYIAERGEKAIFSAIEKPEKVEWASLTEMFEQVLEHEQKVTGLINDIATLSKNENDHASYNFIQWYVDEQVEEESSADEILSTLKFVKEDPVAVYNMDKEFQARVFVDPFANAK
ncbi:MAG: ferritin [Bacillales bacterium]|jgi:ferritin|nr:ferritin [Bacillales bacterium]